MARVMTLPVATTVLSLLLLLLVLAVSVSRAAVLRGMAEFEGADEKRLGATLQSYNVDPHAITVGGISSGAYMAVQLHVTFSNMFSGAGISAGGPFWCAQAQVSIALSSCMKYPSLISVKELIGITESTALSGFIDDTSNLADARVYLYSGTKDTVVHPGVVKKLEEYYEHYLSRNGGSLLTDYEVPSEHAWITDFYGNDCGVLGDPYISNCHYDMAGAMLQHLYNNTLSTPTVPYGGLPQNLLSFSQLEFFPGLWTSETISLHDVGYVYVPTACQQGAMCKLFVMLHGCLMYPDKIGTTFLNHSGLHRWAETNNIIVLWPQARTNALNPNGCFDWWGFTGPEYASNVGPQMVTIKKMLERLVFGH